MKALLSITVDDFLQSFRDENTQQNLYKHLSSVFDITTPSDITRLKFFSLTICQSDFGTNTDQINYIQCTVLAPCLKIVTCLKS